MKLPIRAVSYNKETKPYNQLDEDFNAKVIHVKQRKVLILLVLRQSNSVFGNMDVRT